MTKYFFTKPTFFEEREQTIYLNSPTSLKQPLVCFQTVKLQEMMASPWKYIKQTSSIPCQFFKRLKAIMHTFIWMGQKTCIKLDTITKPKEVVLNSTTLGYI